VPQAEFGGVWLQVRLAGEPGERAAAGVMGEQRDGDAEWLLPAPVGFDVVEEILAPRRPQAPEPRRAELADLARRVPLALAGAGATAQIADAAGARLMAGDPVTEAERAGWPR
jgi:hypothetical protein